MKAWISAEQLQRRRAVDDETVPALAFDANSAACP